MSYSFDKQDKLKEVLIEQLKSASNIEITFVPKRVYSTHGDKRQDYTQIEVNFNLFFSKGHAKINMMFDVDDWNDLTRSQHE